MPQTSPRYEWVRAVLQQVREGECVTVPVPRGVSTRDAWNALKWPLHIWTPCPKPQQYLPGRKWSGPAECDCDSCLRWRASGN